MGLPNIGPIELIIILAVLLLVVGPRRLPEMGQAVGKTIREFRKASTEITESATVTADAKTVSPAPATVAAAASMTPDTAPAAAPVPAVPPAPAAPLADASVEVAPQPLQSPEPDPVTAATDDAPRA
jgi:sec-independent protein translocase protein TatA